MTASIASKELAGWGNHPRVACDVVRPETIAALRRTVAAGSAGAPLIARGLGRSYGDPAVSDRGQVVDCTRLDRYLDFDPETGVLTCEAGVTLEMILRDFGPRGFLPAITPGTKFVTIGGCIANDVHGKAHHVDGCFSRCTESFRILLANGEHVHASPTENADLYWANFGGMGLLGIITDATIRLRKVTTTWFRQKAVSVPNLDAMLDAIDQSQDVPYSVAWVDSFATGAGMGRGVLTTGDHASVEELPPSQQRAPLSIAPRSPLVLPVEMPTGALNKATIRILNATIGQVQKRSPEIVSYEKFFYPLDFIGEWNRGYGAKGFTQYQFVVPTQDGHANIRELLSRISRGGQLPFLNILKRFGEEHPETMLSFPMEGYTYAIDFPVRDGLAELLAELDQCVLNMGGRIYLGKDAFLARSTFEAMYPRLDEWRAVKRRVDPHNVFSSNLSRRLGLSG